MEHKGNSTSLRPYVYGALTGVLLTVSVAITGQFFGTSTTFPRMATLILSSVGIDLSGTTFYQVRDGALTGASIPNRQLLFVICIGVGAFIAAKATKTCKSEDVPEMRTQQFGPEKRKRILYSLAGGAVALIGARMAGGCPSGHGMSSLVTVSMFFIAGIATARVLDRAIGGVARNW